jgi:hypothetical protein
MASIDETHRFNYARALAICGTARSRPLLAEWTHDRRPDVCAAAFEGLAHVGLDEDAVRLAIDALDREALAFGISVTLMAVLLSDMATRRYMRGRDLALLVAVVVLEHCGYRQLNAWWSCIGTVQAMRGQTGWGVMRRRAFGA